MYTYAVVTPLVTVLVATIPVSEGVVTILVVNVLPAEFVVVTATTTGPVCPAAEVGRKALTPDSSAAN